MNAVLNCHLATDFYVFFTKMCTKSELDVQNFQRRTTSSNKPQDPHITFKQDFSLLATSPPNLYFTPGLGGTEIWV